MGSTGGTWSGAAVAGTGTPVPGTGAAGGGWTRGDWTGVVERSELVGQVHDGVVRCCAQLLPYPLFVGAGILQRPRPVAGRDECAHETQGRTGTERIQPCQRFPPFRGEAVPPIAGRPGGRGLERIGQPPAEPGALLLHPLLELGQIRQGEAVEEGATVPGDRLLRIVARERRFEIPQVAGEVGWIELEVGDPGEHRILAQLAPDGVEGLVQRIAGPSGVALGPQVEQDLVARDPPTAGRCQDGEQGQRPAPGNSAFGEPGPVFQGQAPQQPKPVFGRGLSGI